VTELVPAAALVLAAAIWGTTFPLVKDALREIGAFEFLAIRFCIATLVYTVIWPGVARKALKVGVQGGLIAGALLAAGHGFQTTGLHLTRSTNAGFITGLYVVFTPLLAAVFLRRRPSAIVLFGVGLTTAGLALMSLRITGGHVGVNVGDLLVLLCAVSYGGQIVAVGRWAPDADARVLTLQQFAVTFVVFAAITPVEHVTVPTSRPVWIALLATAIGSSVYGIGMQTWAQKRISPTRAAVIYSSEAPFAALAAYFLADERLPSRAWLGAVLILVGMLVVEMRPTRSRAEA
jgi:drug/metabolite transporter (DMT)-like permease